MVSRKGWAVVPQRVLTAERHAVLAVLGILHWATEKAPSGRYPAPGRITAAVCSGRREAITCATVEQRLAEDDRRLIEHVLGRFLAGFGMVVHGYACVDPRRFRLLS